MPSALQMDPTRTTTLRRQYVADMKRRFAKLSRQIAELIISEDAFGIIDRDAAQWRGITANTRWQFLTDQEKVSAFRVWLAQMFADGVLEHHGDAIPAEPWMADYVESAYNKGKSRAYIDTRTAQGIASDVAVDTFAGPVRASKLELLMTRNFEGLRGITGDMGRALSQTLAQGLADGTGAYKLARRLTDEVGKLTRKRALTLARTELINAHSEGQLDSFEELGVTELGVFVEWATAGDSRVCPLCSAMSGVVLDIKNARVNGQSIIPRHPNCRCAFLPANIVPDESPDQKFSKTAIQRAVAKSLRAEKPKARSPRTASAWVGADITPRTKQRRRK